MAGRESFLGLFGPWSFVACKITSSCSWKWKLREGRAPSAQSEITARAGQISV